MKKLNLFIAIATILIFFFMYLETLKLPQEKEIENNHSVDIVVGEVIDATIIQAESTYPKYDIPLSPDLQEYIWNLSNEYEISYEMVLAVIYVESGFRPYVISRTGDYGLMQLNGVYMHIRAEAAGVYNFEPLNMFDNVRVGIHLLSGEINYWRSQEIGEENVFVYALGSYNRGRYGLRKYGIPWRYVNKVSDYKSRLEQQNL